MSAARDPEAALMLGALYRNHLGGSFIIDCTGQRRIVRDFDKCSDFPVAMLIEQMLDRLHPADKDYLFDAYGECDPAIPQDFEEPRRAA